MSPSVETVKSESVAVRGRPARVFHGGRGPGLLLIHGGWSGAEAHWSSVLARLAETFEVVAPDLPGFEDDAPGGPRSVDDYADWLLALLDAMGLSRVACVGNSFGASVGWSFALRHAARCDALVIVNGIAMPRTPWPLRLLGALSPARSLLRRLIARNAYRPDLLAQAFFDPSRAPESIRRVLASSSSRSLDRMVDAFILGGSTVAPPRVPTLLLWGAADRLRQSRRATAEKLHRAIEGSSLVLIPEAGHLPQRERPEEFVAALRSFLKVPAPAAG